ncbi:MAG TPA: type II toxin-antitoxin system RelE/ParE family toxin [Candidatus Lustribacter sp.]|nr:type II toxin-antitoxin system RelE/ParE family toxin [Candidatus Lustribacter sp.]
MTYEVALASSAQRDLQGIPPRYASAILEFIYSVLPDNPRRVGKPLGRDLEGIHSARRGDYRVLYEVHEHTNEVVVIRVSHRASAYRKR